jgi:hypothetical protein
VLSNAVKANPYFAPPYRVLVDCLSKLGDRQGAAYYANIYQQLGGGRQ